MALVPTSSHGSSGNRGGNASNRFVLPLVVSLVWLAALVTPACQVSPDPVIQ